MSRGIQLAFVCFTALVWFAQMGNARQAAVAESDAIECRALEVHTSATPAATAVVFHQERKDDQERLAEILRAHSGETVEVQLRDAAWTGATMFRLKSCFGRGLLLLPMEAPAMKDGSTFRLRLSSAAGKS
jgi:hypothetical protein